MQNSIAEWRYLAAIHREMERSALRDEAMLYHRMWAARYERLIQDHTDYFAITRAVSA